MVRARGDIKLFPSECGPWRVRLLSKVVQIVGLVGFYSDVVVEKWSSKDEIWKPVNMLRKVVKNSKREHIRFRCSGVTSSYVYLHQFVYFCNLGRPLTLAKWKQWREYCRKHDLDVDHAKQKWWRAVRAELKLEKAGINRRNNARWSRCSPVCFLYI